MDFGIIAQNLVEDIAKTFNSELTQKEEMLLYDNIKQRIHGLQWRSDILNKLNHYRDWQTTTGDWLAEWFVEYVHKLLCGPTETEKPPSFKFKHLLSQYPPSEYVLGDLKYEQSIPHLQAQNAILREYVISHELNAANIVEIFKLFIELEDVASLHEYAPLIQSNIKLTKQNSKNYSAYYNSRTPENIKDILTPNLDVVAVIPKKESKALNSKPDVASINSIISKYGDLKNSVAVIKKVTATNVCFQFDNPPKIKEDKTEYDLIFFSMRYPIRYQHRALDLLAKNLQIREYLFPKPIKAEYPVPTNDFELLNPDIAENPEQMQAVRYISSGPNPHAPYIVFGPPGTGKTTTIVESILQLRLQRPESRILVTAGSNSACDTIALRICQYFKSSPRLQEHLSSAEALPIIRIFSKSIYNFGINNVPDDLLLHSNLSRKCPKHTYPAVEDIRKYGVVVVTLCMIGKLVCGDIDVHDHFTHIFIDEAAASTEPETLVGIMGIKKSSDAKCRVILSGDPKQLGPVLKSDCAEKLGLQLSMMQRLLDSKCYSLDKNGNYDRSLQTRLRRNYRSHAEIVNIYNTLFYNNELLAMGKLCNNKIQRRWSFLPDSDYPIIFQAVHGVTEKNNMTSFCNILEIDVLVWYIERLIKHDKVKQHDIGVIAPYKLQCQQIQKRFNKRNWKDIEVGSVEKFQGREKDIIIASMVRSFSSLGFLRSPLRFNVMLSRAKSLLIIMGNPLSLRHYKDMEFFIEKCKEKGTYLCKEKSK